MISTRKNSIEKAKKLVQELLQLGRLNGAQAYVQNNGTVPYRIKQIGQELDVIGGMEYMQAAHYAVSQEIGGSAARCLEVAWNGIGEWRG